MSLSSFPLSSSQFFSLPLFQTLETAENADCSLMDRDIMQVIFTLAKAGHQHHVPEMAERLRHERNYIPGIHANTFFHSTLVSLHNISQKD